MQNMPIIRLEIQGMKVAIHQALSEYVVNMDSDIKKAVDEACTPENISTIIRQTANREIESAIQAEVTTFFRYGAGREAIKQAVAQILEKTE